MMNLPDETSAAALEAQILQLLNTHPGLQISMSRQQIAELDAQTLRVLLDSIHDVLANDFDVMREHCEKRWPDAVQTA